MSTIKITYPPPSVTGPDWYNRQVFTDKQAYVASPTGWRCPSCSRCYSPATSMCQFCGPLGYPWQTTITVNDKAPQFPQGELLPSGEVRTSLPDGPVTVWESVPVQTVLDRPEWEHPNGRS